MSEKDAGKGDPEEMISCQEALEKVYEYLDGELGSPEQEKVREHVKVCRKCYPLFDFERAFLDFVREKGFAEEASGELLERVQAIVREGG
jgi:mycothiol system anti-sigma-R factor